MATALSSSSIRVSWNAVSNAYYYYIWRAASANGTYTEIGYSYTTSYEDTGLSASTTYYYKVDAGNDVARSVLSASATATTQSSGSGGGVTKPNAPYGVTATALSSSSISVSWNAVSGATSYRVYYEIGSSSTKNLAGTAYGTSYTHNSLQANTTYYYYITAVNSAGESGYSSFSSATTQSSSGGGGTTEYRIAQPTFGNCSRSGNDLIIRWTLTTSGKSPNGLYTYTQPTSIIIGVQNNGNYTDIQTLSASARSFTLNNYSVFATGYNNDRVYLRVKCTSSYNETVSYIGYSISTNTFTPSY
jgi:hypothetical protein